MENHFRKIVIRMTFETVIGRLTHELNQQGFEVTGTTDFHHSVNSAIQVAPGKYSVLTVHHPMLYEQLMRLAPFEGIILPCFVSVVESHTAETCIIPYNVTKRIVQGILNPELAVLTAEVSARIDRAVGVLQNDQNWAPDLITSWG